MLPFLMFANKKAGEKSAARRAFYGSLGERNILGIINQFQPMLITDTEEKRARAYDRQIYDAFLCLSYQLNYHSKLNDIFFVQKMTENVPDVPDVVKKRIQYEIREVNSMNAMTSRTYDRDLPAWFEVWVSDNPHVREIWNIIDNASIDAWKKCSGELHDSWQINSCISRILQEGFRWPSYLQQTMPNGMAGHNMRNVIMSIVQNLVKWVALITERVETWHDDFMYGEKENELTAWALIGLSQKAYPLQIVETVLKPKITWVPKQTKTLGRRSREDDEKQQPSGSRKYARLTANRQTKK